MGKNLFFLSFLYVYIACTLFIAATVHSTGLPETMAPFQYRSAAELAGSHDGQ
jgi:hypothetical protein